MLLPSFSTLEEYRPLFRDESVWLPALKTICARHGLDACTLRIAPPGTHIVFWVEDNLLLKLFSPLWPGDSRTEIAVLKALSERCPFEIPRITAEGELEGWPYLVLTRLKGQPLDEIWPDLNRSDQELIAASLGRLIAVLGALSLAGMKGLLPQWPGSWRNQASDCLERQRKLGVPSAWLDQITAFLDASLPVLQIPFEPVFLHADLTPEHLFCQEGLSGWQVTGLIDFADAMLGHPFYEFVAPGYITHSSPSLRRAMLLAAGFRPDLLNETFSRSLLAFTLLHRFSNLPDMLALFSPNPPANLEALQSAMWGL